MRDEEYVLNICDEILNHKSIRQHRFDFLRGDSAPNKKGRSLPVDAYYVCLNLVIEYHERQHSESVKFFDRKETCSGVSRGEQRKIYDQRRRDILPKNGIKIFELSYSDFEHNKSDKRIIRDENRDKKIVRNKLKVFCGKKPN